MNQEKNNLQFNKKICNTFSLLFNSQQQITSQSSGTTCMILDLSLIYHEMFHISYSDLFCWDSDGDHVTSEGIPSV